MKWKNNLNIWLSHRFIKSVWKKGIFQAMGLNIQSLPCYIGKDGNCWNWTVVSWTASLCSAWKCLQLSHQIPCSLQSSVRESANMWVVGKLEYWLTKQNTYSSPALFLSQYWVASQPGLGRGSGDWSDHWGTSGLFHLFLVAMEGGSGPQFSAHLFKRKSIWRLGHCHCLRATTSEATV